jgi:hypothetical protein
MKRKKPLKKRETSAHARVVFKSGVTVCIAVLIVAALAHAGTLTPSASPAATSHTLDDIYTRLTTNATSTAGSHLFAPGSTPAATLRTLTEIYSAIPTIVATSVRSGTSYLGVSGTYTPDFPTLSNVCDTDTSDNATGTLTVASSTIGVGNTYCGVAGILLKDQFNGSLGAGGFPGGSQANGGVEDSNNGGSPAIGRYARTWTACSSGNNYCGTGDAGADMKDDSTGLVWSLPCNGSGYSRTVLPHRIRGIHPARIITPARRCNYAAIIPAGYFHIKNRSFRPISMGHTETWRRRARTDFIGPQQPNLM